MKVTVQYAIEFGKCDVSDWIPFDVELTPEEEATYKDAIARGDDPNEVPELYEVLNRAREEIEANEAAVCEELDEEDLLEDDGCTVYVQFP